MIFQWRNNKQTYMTFQWRKWNEHTTISFPAFSVLLAKLIAATAAAPDEMPTFQEVKIF